VGDAAGETAKNQQFKGLPGRGLRSSRLDLSSGLSFSSSLQRQGQLPAQAQDAVGVLAADLLKALQQ